jgi:tetratricopeptide (TPR) repeat protein
VWGPEQRAAIERAFASTGHKRAAQAFASTAALLDQYAARWTQQYTAACEATHVRGDQSADVLDLRMECLDERLSGVKALTNVFATADPAVVDNAATAVGSLPTLERCADVSMLRAVVKLPDDPAKRAEVARLREDVAKVSALSSAGRCDQATTIGAPVREAARRVGYQPLEAEIAFALGRFVDTCFDTRQALADLEDAVMAAEASHHDEIAIDASASLANTLGNRVHDARMARHWIRLGEAILARFRGHPALEARIAASRGVVLSAEGKYEDAVNDERHAMAIQESLFGPDSLDVAMSANNIAVFLHELGRDEEAEAMIQRALAIFMKAFGEDSGRIAVSSMNEVEILTALGRFEPARAAIPKVRATFERQDAGEFAIGYLLLDQGKLELAEGKPREAVNTLEESLLRMGAQDPRYAAEARFALARALWQSAPSARKRAIDLTQSARDGIADKPDAYLLRRDIAVWERDHVLPRAPATPRPGSD